MSNGFGNGGSNSGHRVSRRDKKQQRRDDVNGDQDRTDGFKKPARPAHQFNGGEKKNGNSYLLGMRVTPINHERTAILQQIHDLEHLGLLRNPDSTSMDYYIRIDAKSPEGIQTLAELRGKLEKLNAGKSDVGVPQHDTGPVQDR